MNKLFPSAKWIWHNDYHKENVYLNFFETVKGTKGKNYKVYISVDSNYALYINERFVESGQYADYLNYKVYDVIDVTDFIEDGENAIRIVGYWQGRDCSTYRKEAAGMMYVITEDGKEIVVSDEKSQVALNSCYQSENVPMTSGQLGFNYAYNCLNADEKTGLKNADVQDKDVPMFPRPIKKLDIGEKMPSKIIARGEIKDNGAYNNAGERMQNAYMSFRYNPSKIPLPSADGIELKAESAESEGIYFIIDRGCETVGYTDIEIEVPEECDIVIGHGEHLDDMRVRAFIGGRVFAAPYRAKAGLNKFFNPMRRLGLRYMQINIYAKTAKVHYAGIRTTHYPVSYEPYFKCSDHLHNKIYEISLKTLEHCMHDHYEDCPWREQALYAMDSRNQMLCGYYCFSEFDFAKSSLRLIGLSLRDDNLTELCSPARVRTTIPCFCAIYVTQIYEYLIHSGDKDFAREMLDVITRITDNFASMIKENGLLTALTEPKHWNFYEWQTGMNPGYGSDDMEKLTYDAPLCAFVSMALSSLSGVYRILGDKESAEKYMKLHNNLNAAIDKHFWNDEVKAYNTYIKVASGEKTHLGELTQALIVYCGACPEDKIDDVLGHIAAGEYYPATLSHSIFKYEALMRRPEKYAKFVLNDIAKDWGHMLYNNATTFWETIDGADAFGNAGSLCHGWSAIPVYIYFKYAAGYNISDDGNVTYTKKPVNCGLYECEALVVTPDGKKIK